MNKYTIRRAFDSIINQRRDKGYISDAYRNDIEIIKQVIDKYIAITEDIEDRKKLYDSEIETGLDCCADIMDDNHIIITQNMSNLCDALLAKLK